MFNLMESGLALQAASIGKGNSTEAKVEVHRDQPAPLDVCAWLHDEIGDLDRFEMEIHGIGVEDETVEPRLEIHGEWMRSEDVEGLLKKLEKALREHAKDACG